jgi:CheY-like chemotaxis protein/two-component sensor histidine kinase
MERQLGHLGRLVDDLLDVSRITRNRIELRREPVELASIVQQSIDACSPLLDQARHQLTVSVPPGIYLDADPVRLVQVFYNILNNAAKYTEPGGRIGVIAEVRGDRVTVRVSDTGVGIPKDKLRSVFEMFAQVDRTLERAQGGLGIGLTLVKTLVEMHGGTVTAASEGPGKGSEFIVDLPVLTETLRHAAPATAPVPPAARRFLVVDDNVDSAASLAMLLSISGHETHVAHDGEQAIEAAERYRPDVILLDIGLPKMNGYDACRYIRAQDWGQSMVLIALTGWGQDDDRSRSSEAGFDHHMVKPADYNLLMTLLTPQSTEEDVRS